jgi:invasion protein IalB
MSRISACLRRRPHFPWLASFSTQVERARPVPVAAGRGRLLSGISPSLASVARLGLALILIAGVAGRTAAGPAAEPGAASEAAPAATGPGSVVRETHGAWQVSCRTPPGAKEEKCALLQSVTAEDRPNVGLTVMFYKEIGAEKKLMRVVVPLGVLLPTGLGLKIDGQDFGNAPFLKCTSRGCVAEVVLEDDLIGKMKKGTTAMFIIFDTPEAGIGIPVALQGFGDAFRNLK